MYMPGALTFRERTFLDSRHLARMTTGRGMLQFSRGSEPDPMSGITVDDNARALIVALSLPDDSEGYKLAKRYTEFMRSAQRADGTWCNWWLPDRGFVTDIDSQDSIARAFLACCLGIQAPWPDIRQNCREMMEKAFLAVRDLRYPRSIAYSVIAGVVLIEHEGKHRDFGWKLAKEGVQALAESYLKFSGPGWKWFEDEMTYCNAILPHALFAFCLVKADRRIQKVASESLHFLAEHVFARGYFTPCGNQGWFQRGGSMPLFDQQPVEAGSMALCCWTAHEATGNSAFREMAKASRDWYHGANIHSLSLYNPETGGCYDALTPEGLNLNQGAEAVLSLLLTEVFLSKYSINTGINSPAFHHNWEASLRSTPG